VIPAHKKLIFQRTLRSFGSAFFISILSSFSLTSSFLVVAWMFHGSPAATADIGVLPGVLGCRTLRRTIQVRLETNTLRLPGGTFISTVSRLRSMKHPGKSKVEIFFPSLGNCLTHYPWFCVLIIWISISNFRKSMRFIVLAHPLLL